MKNIVGLRQLREQTEEIINAVKHGNSVLVMRRNKPLFQISPVDNDAWEEVIDFTKLARGGIELGALLKRL